MIRGGRASNQSPDLSASGSVLGLMVAYLLNAVSHFGESHPGLPRGYPNASTGHLQQPLLFRPQLVPPRGTQLAPLVALGTRLCPSRPHDRHLAHRDCCVHLVLLRAGGRCVWNVRTQDGVSPGAPCRAQPGTDLFPFFFTERLAGVQKQSLL